MRINVDVNNPDQSSLDAALGVLKRGGVIVFPTETAYGLGCDAYNEDAVQMVREIKQRPFEKAFIMIVGFTKRARELEGWNDIAEDLAEKYWPGPLTLELVPGTAVRVPDSTFARQLAVQYKKPIIATSANLSGGKTCFSLDCVLRQIPESAVDLILDGGELPEKGVSTVVSVSGSKPRIVRPGVLDIEEAK